MPTKDELETKLYEKMSQENEAFLAEMKTQSLMRSFPTLMRSPAVTTC